MASLLKPWTKLLPPTEPASVVVPTIDVLLVAKNGQFREVTFLVDSGADVSLAPRTLCDWIGLDWELGSPVVLHGIATNPDCDVAARVLDVELVVPELSAALTMPICFADGDSSLLLGREGFFDCFRIEFDKSQNLTKFELVESNSE